MLQVHGNHSYDCVEAATKKVAMHAGVIGVNSGQRCKPKLSKEHAATEMITVENATGQGPPLLWSCSVYCAE